MLSLSLGSIAGAIALVPGGGAAVAAVARALDYLLHCSACLKILAVLAAIGFTALHVHRADVAHCDARIETDHRQAAAAAAQRDKDVARDLGDFYGPKLEDLHRQNQLLQDKVNQYAKRKAPANAAVTPGKPAAALRGCPLGDAAGLLRPAPR
jgi:hypothetical protein